jgi:hypothetical protein
VTTPVPFITLLKGYDSLGGRTARVELNYGRGVASAILAVIDQGAGEGQHEGLRAKATFAPLLNLFWP